MAFWASEIVRNRRYAIATYGRRGVAHCVLGALGWKTR